MRCAAALLLAAAAAAPAAPHPAQQQLTIGRGTAAPSAQQGNSSSSSSSSPGGGGSSARDSPVVSKVCGENLGSGNITWYLHDVHRNINGALHAPCPPHSPADLCCLGGDSVKSPPAGSELTAFIYRTSYPAQWQQTTPVVYDPTSPHSISFICTEGAGPLGGPWKCRLHFVHHTPIEYPPQTLPDSPFARAPADLPPVIQPEPPEPPPGAESPLFYAPGDGGSGPPRWFIDAVAAAGGTAAVLCAAAAVLCCRKPHGGLDDDSVSAHTEDVERGLPRAANGGSRGGAAAPDGGGPVEIHHLSVPQHAVAGGQVLYAVDVFAPPAHAWRLWRSDTDFDALRLRVGASPCARPPPLDAHESVMEYHRQQHEIVLRGLLARSLAGGSGAAGLRQALATFAEVEPHTRHTPVRELGKGGFGTVWLCRRRDSDMLVSLKRVTCRSPRERQRALREVRMLQGLPRHPSIIQVIEVISLGSSPDDANPHAGVVCMVLPYFPQGDLARYIQNFPDPVMPEPLVLSFVGQLCDALRLLHSLSPPVVHRDLKPANILVAEDQRRVVITDFGLARLHDETYMHTHVGTMAFMAPEAFDGPYDSQVDLWSLGCVIYAMATKRVRQCRVMCVHVGQTGFYTQVERELRDRGYSPLLVDLVLQLLQPHRRNRPSAEEVCYRLSSAAPSSVRLGRSPQSPGAGLSPTEQQHSKKRQTSFRGPLASPPERIMPEGVPRPRQWSQDSLPSAGLSARRNSVDGASENSSVGMKLQWPWGRQISDKGPPGGVSPPAQHSRGAAHSSAQGSAGAALRLAWPRQQQQQQPQAVPPSDSQQRSGSGGMRLAWPPRGRPGAVPPQPRPAGGAGCEQHSDGESAPSSDDGGDDVDPSFVLRPSLASHAPPRPAGAEQTRPAQQQAVLLRGGVAPVCHTPGGNAPAEQPQSSAAAGAPVVLLRGALPPRMRDDPDSSPPSPPLSQLQQQQQRQQPIDPLLRGALPPLGAAVASPTLAPCEAASPLPSASASPPLAGRMCWPRPAASLQQSASDEDSATESDEGGEQASRPLLLRPHALPV